MNRRWATFMRRAGLKTVDGLVADALLHPGIARLLLSKAPYRPDQGIWKMLATHYGRAARAAAFIGAEKQVNRSPRARQPLELTVSKGWNSPATMAGQ
jgi:hypothetical protein